MAQTAIPEPSSWLLLLIACGAMRWNCTLRDLFLLSLSLFVGCTRAQPRLAQPGIDAGAAAAAIGKYDGNSDGMIGGDELAKVPAFKSAIKRIDKDGDGKINAAEIDERLAV